MLLKGCKMAKRIELDVGERRIINDMAVECTLSSTIGENKFSCRYCALSNMDCSLIACIPDERKDGENVYFKRVE